MKGEVLISAENVSKKFCRDLKRSLWYGVLDLFNEMLGIRPSRNKLRKDEFWAINGIDFELRRGECLGLIGHNGAGKSTLLKMLNGLIRPDGGKIVIKGRVGALIELGAGFNPILTGRENIYINGQILGLSKSEINKKLNSIVDFAEIEEFIDTPVQNYSSGMKIRLGFAIAAQLEPDVLIIDEVLAVGDVGFRIKCLNAINNLLSKTAIIFVSHSMPQIAKICTQLLVLKQGSAKYLGNSIGDGINSYFDEFESNSSQEFNQRNVKIDSLSLNDVDCSSNQSPAIIEYGHDLVMSLDFTPNVPLTQVEIDLGFLDRESKQVAIYSSGHLNTTNGRNRIRITIPKMLFVQGEYSINVAFFEINKDSTAEYNLIIALFNSIAKFRVIGSTLSRHAIFQLIGSLEQVN